LSKALAQIQDADFSQGFNLPSKRQRKKRFWGESSAVWK